MLRFAVLLFLPCLILFVGLCGCDSEEANDPAAQTPTQNDTDPTAEAQAIFRDRCVTCHGETGLGDGPGSHDLAVHPRNFSDPEWQASVTDQHIQDIIMYGGAAVGRDPAMPSNPDLISKPNVVIALRDHVRSLIDAQASTDFDE